MDPKMHGIISKTSVDMDETSVAKTNFLKPVHAKTKLRAGDYCT